MSHSKTELAQKLFPLGYAEGPSFCNRDEERERLKRNILSGRHTYITGMRLYGKTSLVRQVAAELRRKRSPKVHTYSIDLLTVHTLETLDALLRDAVGRLSAEFLPSNKRVLGTLAKFFAGFKPELTVRQDGFSVKLFSDKVSTKSISELLIGLDQAARHYKRRAVLILDEFQNIAMIDHGETIEESIRLAAKEANALSFVFLGSERRSLEMMFEEAHRPMKNSASEHLQLERISEQDYRPFLEDAARLRWSKGISEMAIDAILELSDRHPNYVNMLCRDLWLESRPPSVAAVNATWIGILKLQRNQAHREIASLAHAQRTVLKAMAIEPTSQPTASGYLAQFKIANSTMRRSLDVLLERDFVRKTSSGVYEVVDPLVKGVMAARIESEPL